MTYKPKPLVNLTSENIKSEVRCRSFLLDSLYLISCRRPSWLYTSCHTPPQTVYISAYDATNRPTPTHAQHPAHSQSQIPLSKTGKEILNVQLCKPMHACLDMQDIDRQKGITKCGATHKGRSKIINRKEINEIDMIYAENPSLA